MAESMTAEPVAFPKTIEEARALARNRFKQRLEAGEQIGNCDCSATPEGQAPGSSIQVAGVRFLDSGRLFYFDPAGHALATGDWIVVETVRGKEAGRVVLAPHQIYTSMITGELKPVLRVLDAREIERMYRLRDDSARAVKLFGQKARERNLPMKPISAEYNYDGSHLTLNFTAPERVDFRELAKELAATFHCRVELHQVGPRDEARLLGGLGRCGRTLCCSSWLPVYPEISMNMAKTQDLPLNPGKVSGVCGRLLCCLSYENEQYKQMKATMPRLGQTIETPAGPGMVVSLQILKELVTVRLASDNTEQVMSAAELGLRKPEPASSAAQTAPVVQSLPALDEVDDESMSGEGAEATTTGPDAPRKRRRRGRGRRRGGGGTPAAAEA